MKLYVSKDHTAEEYGDNPSIERKIEVLESRVKNWYINIGLDIEHQINQDDDPKGVMKHAGYSLIPMFMSYFEMIAGIRATVENEGSGKRFKRGFKDVYPESSDEELMTAVWKRVRNGVYHSWYAGNGAIISGLKPVPFMFDEHAYLWINPHQLVKTIAAHFDTLLADLKNDTNTALRDNFAATFMGPEA